MTKTRRRGRIFPKRMEEMGMLELNHQDVLNILPDRNPESHKGNYGRILLLCGSVGYTGAAALAAMGALHAR